MEIVLLIDSSIPEEYHQTVNDIVRYQKKTHPENKMTIVVFGENNTDYICQSENVTKIEEIKIQHTDKSFLYDKGSAILVHLNSFYEKIQVESVACIIISTLENESSCNISENQFILQLARNKTSGWKVSLVNQLDVLKDTLNQELYS
jgi:hypothetical protein